MNDSSLDAIAKLNEFYRQAGMYKVENIDIIKTIVNALYNDKNLLLRYKMNNRSTELTIPLMTKVFEQGKNEGVFNIEFPKATARIILFFGIINSCYCFRYNNRVCECYCFRNIRIIHNRC